MARDAPRPGCRLQGESRQGQSLQRGIPRGWGATAPARPVERLQGAFPEWLPDSSPPSTRTLFSSPGEGARGSVPLGEGPLTHERQHEVHGGEEHRGERPAPVTPRLKSSAIPSSRPAPGISTPRPPRSRSAAPAARSSEPSRSRAKSVRGAAAGAGDPGAPGGSGGLRRGARVSALLGFQVRPELEGRASCEMRGERARSLPSPPPPPPPPPVCLSPYRPPPPTPNPLSPASGSFPQPGFAARPHLGFLAGRLLLWGARFKSQPRRPGCARAPRGGGSPSGFAPKSEGPPGSGGLGGAAD
ncbi:uncharacterized protein LOC141521242 [Macrotis lagotis]|uniref:uncharacterized protein LOC141521242 n=1 Tax=Macrotis lagotis TaxID=92651 RepID=UPI003D682C3D